MNPIVVRFIDEGESSYIEGDARAARHHFSTALQLARDVSCINGEITALNELGTAYRALDMYDEARSCHEKGLSLAVESDDRVLEAAFQGQLGLDHNTDNSHNLALDAHRKQCELCRELKDRAGEATALQNVAATQLLLGLSSEASEGYEAAGMIRSELGDHEAAVRSFCGGLLVQLCMGNWEAAHQCSELAETALGKVNEACNDTLAEQQAYKAMLRFARNRSCPLAGAALKVALAKSEERQDLSMAQSLRACLAACEGLEDRSSLPRSPTSKDSRNCEDVSEVLLNSSSEGFTISF